MTIFLLIWSELFSYVVKTSLRVSGGNFWRKKLIWNKSPFTIDFGKGKLFGFSTEKNRKCCQNCIVRVQGMSYWGKTNEKKFQGIIERFGI